VSLEKGVYPSSVNQSLWESPVWIIKTTFSDTFNQELLAEMYAIANTIKLGLDTNVGSSLLDYAETNPRLRELLETKERIITKVVNQYLPDSHTAEFAPISSWLNVKEPGEVIEMHGHPDSTIACTYYITTPAVGGELYYLDTGKVGVHNTSIKYIKPEVGDLIFFPSYVLHGVSANKDQALRVSLSTDYKYKLTDDSKDQLVITSWVDSMIKIKDLL
jgi:uncharacterized protein (TIGR02466 family)